jgi:Zn-dependent M28 family amino/carboxypeptidase
MIVKPVGLRAELLATVEDLARFGEKRTGSEAGLAAAEYLVGRMRALGLQDVHADRFAFPRHDSAAATLALDVAGSAREVVFAVLEASGAGRVDGEVVHVGWATKEQLDGVALDGRIALVDRNPLYHRSTQYYNVAAAGAAAMILVSTAPANLAQVGSVRRGWEAIGPIPVVTIGAIDGHMVRTALAAHQTVRARLTVDASVARGVGQNVVGHVRGLGDDRIVVGAHYDTWFTGSSDNGGGVAAMLALAARRARRPARHGLTFVAWDGEEIALYGGYHFLRRYTADGQQPLAVIDFETPSALGAQAYGLARSSHAPVENAIIDVGLHELFALNVPMDLVAELFGGVIPTDVQGIYRSGTPAVATAVDAPYYHTVEDTPDKVDLARLEETVIAFDRALDRLMAVAPDRFGVRDPALWRADVTVAVQAPDLVVDVEVRDAGGRPRAGAAVELVLFEDDFFEVASARAQSDESGAARLRLAGAARGGERRFLHVSAGVGWPLVEVVRAI